MSSFWTVVRYSFINRLRSKPFLISTIVFVLLISLGINLPSLINKFTSEGPTVVGMIDDSQGIGKSLQQYYKNKDKAEFNFVLVPGTGSQEKDASLLTDKLKQKEFKGFLELTPDPAGPFPKTVYKGETVIGDSKKADLSEALRLIKMDLNSKSAGLSQEQLARLFGPVTLDTLQISATGEQTGKTESERHAAFALVYVLLFLIFMIVMMYGNLIATEITAEKSSRVMEILITSVSPLKQMFGKVFGMFLLGLSQIVLFVAAGLFNLFVIQNNNSAFEKLGLNLNSVDPALIVYFIVFFILGFFMFAMLFAGVGSLVSRTEDLGQAVMPVTLVALAGFYISIYGLSNPSSSFVTAMSFVPFFTPMLMFLRIGMIGVPAWQIAVGILDLAAGIFLFGWLSAKIYRVGVLMYGKRPSFKEVVKAVKAYRV